MSVLSDRDLKRRIQGDNLKGWNIGINPFEPRQIQPASIDLTLANEWLVYPKVNPDLVGVGEEETLMSNSIDMNSAKGVTTEKIVSSNYMLMPGQLILGSTAEYVQIPDDLQAQVHGKSSLGRLGLLVHVTAGFIDPGFKGKITLEMYNLNNRPIILRAGKPICQISLTTLSIRAEFPYGHEKLRSHYQNQGEVTGSLYDG